MEFEVFKRKLEQASNRLCSEDFKFDLNGSNLNSGIKNTLPKPCYDDLSKVTVVHENIGSYLTKGRANYYILQCRKFSKKEDHIDLWLSFDNNRAYCKKLSEIKAATELPTHYS